MARNISAASLTMLAQRTGGECITVVRVHWGLRGQAFYYADRYIKEHNIEGRILEVSQLEAVIDVNKSGSTTSLHIKLNDSDAVIKNIFNYNDIHGKNVYVYQWFTNLPFSEKILIFEGVIASPIVWNEGERILEFDVLSKLADREIGFSPEEGQFVNLPSELIGKAWPLIFGTVINSTTVKMDDVPSGILGEDIGIPDHHIKRQVNYIKHRQSVELGKAACYSRVGARLKFEGDLGGAGREVYEQGQQYQRQARAIYNNMQKEMDMDVQRFDKMDREQSAQDKSQFHVIGGKYFKQGVEVVLDINGAIYTGTFSDDTFNVSSRIAPEGDTPREPKSNRPVGNTKSPVRILYEDTEEWHDRQIANFIFNEPQEVDTSEHKRTKGGDPCAPPFYYPPPPIIDSLAPHGSESPKEGKPFFAKAGTSIRVGGTYPVRYIVGVTEGITILSVKAKKSVGGIIKLVQIPPHLYTTYSTNYGAVTAYIIELTQPLSTLEDENWQDEVYATVQSNIGPNVVDIIVWAITTYTGYGMDTPSFAAARAYVNPYPANFAMYDRKNVHEFLKEICYQSRLAIWMKENIIYLKYLPAQGGVVESLTENDIELKTMQITTTSTEDIITKYTATWRQDYSTTDKNKLILRWNVAKYGIHEEEYDYYIYNHEVLVEKSATFWMIRRSNVWKILKCRTFITKLKLETLDTALLNFTYNWIANVPVYGNIEKATFNSEDLSIDLEIWTSVRLGEMYPYTFAYPAGMSKDIIFPTKEDELGSYPGGDGPGKNSGGDLSGPGRVDVEIEKFTRPRDIGSAAPGDIGDSSPKSPIDTTTGIYKAGINQGKKPIYDYKFRQYKPPTPPQDVLGTKTIPCKITGYSEQLNDDAHEYTALLYNVGLTGDPVEGKVIQLQQSADDKIPNGSWFMCSRVIWYEKEKPIIVYYIQAPIWLEEPPA